MKETVVLMDMPVTVEIADAAANQEELNKIFDYFRYVDEKFSVFKETSEISKINNGQWPEKNWSADMKEIFRLAAEAKKQTNGYFDIRKPDGQYDPSGLVKGWAIWQAAKILEKDGFQNFYVDAGGDIQVAGKNSNGEDWSVGIKNPINQSEIVKVIYPRGAGVATSGTYIRGKHIYNPKSGQPAEEIVSLTVIGPNIYEADKFATAAFAMGWDGVNFIERLEGFEGYSIDKNGIAVMTSGFENYVK